eukprot:GHVQ01025862.1.p4 GENE.GHVQ01025862.1~~GHVQ01025862.1.p4  ORF type:complete len:105 (-),score=9.10 GHVQ01025862.1:333-647(-)
MKDTIRRIIVMCESCQRRHMCERRHRNTHTGVSSIHSLTGDTACQTVGMDFFGPLPTARSGYKYILVIIDHFTKWPECFACTHADTETAVPTPSHTHTQFRLSM